jgi:hypothetical protein
MNYSCILNAEAICESHTRQARLGLSERRTYMSALGMPYRTYSQLVCCGPVETAVPQMKRKRDEVRNLQPRSVSSNHILIQQLILGPRDSEYLVW